MKNFKNYIGFIAIFALLFISCSQDDEKIFVRHSEKTTLSFGTILNDLVSKPSSLKQHLDNVPNCSDDLPAFVELILSQDGVPVVGTIADPLRINVNPNPGDYDGDGVMEYFTDESTSLELEPGNYTLEYFTVLNNEENMIWIAPIKDENSNFADVLDNPLPYEFSLASGVKKYLSVEVLCFDNRLMNYYGYLFFEFEGVEAIKFCIFGNYCNENGRHAEAVRYRVDVWKYSGNDDEPRGEVLYENMESGIIIEDNFEEGTSETFAVPLCFALPDSPGLDEYYFEIILLSGVGYNVEDQIIRRGVISDEDVRDLFEGQNNVDYYHFQEGNCNSGDSPILFEKTGSNLPILVNLTTAENANLTFTTIEIRGEVVGGNSELINAGVIWSENSNPTLDGDRIYEYESPFKSILSGLNPGQTYYYKLYAVTEEGTVFSEEMSFVTPTLAGTTWDFLFLHNTDITWRADVSFYEDGTAFYTEPEAPGRYDSWGRWFMDGNVLNYEIFEGDNVSGNYVMTGTLEGNDMSGTYTFGERNPQWVAVKYDL